VRGRKVVEGGREGGGIERNGIRGGNETGKVGVGGGEGEGLLISTGTSRMSGLMVVDSWVGTILWCSGFLISS